MGKKRKQQKLDAETVLADNLEAGTDPRLTKPVVRIALLRIAGKIDDRAGYRAHVATLNALVAEEASDKVTDLVAVMSPAYDTAMLVWKDHGAGVHGTPCLMGCTEPEHPLDKLKRLGY